MISHLPRMVATPISSLRLVGDHPVATSLFLDRDAATTRFTGRVSTGTDVVSPRDTRDAIESLILVPRGTIS